MMRIALAQMVVDDGELEPNVQRARDALQNAPDADVYLLPELWSTGYGHETWADAADHSTPRLLTMLRDLAEARGASIGGSLLSRRADGALANRFWLIPPVGDATWYDKGHLFAPLGEPRYLKAGDVRARVPIAGWTAALSICFDLRFPEHYRSDAVDGADLFLVASAWPHPRSAIFQALARARAIENQAVLAVCNRVGPSRDGLAYCGGSMVIAPDGTVLADAGEREGVVVATVDRQSVLEARGALPVLPLRAAGLDW